MELLDNWKEEKRSAYLYKVIASVETNPTHQKLFSELAVMAESQADIWVQQIKKADGKIPGYAPDMSARFIASLIRLLGTRYLRILLELLKFAACLFIAARSITCPSLVNWNNNIKP